MNNRFLGGMSAFAAAAGLLTSAAAAAEEEEYIELEAVVATASPFAVKKEDLVVPASQMPEATIHREGRSTLGATLDSLPGVHSSYFGPGAGRPVIRGLDGDRIRILNNGTDAFDVSNTSPDHGVGLEPLFAREIEVVRGPATLLYGNAAIGGVVNAIGRELPRERAAASLSGQFQAGYGTAADERDFGLALQGGEGNFAWSAGYLVRRSNDVEIPGYAESRFQRAMEEHDEDHHDEGEEDHDHDDEEHADHEEEGDFGTLSNSAVSTDTGYMGATWFGQKGSAGVYFTRYESQYGVPGHSHAHGHDEEHDEEDHGDEEHEEHEGEEHSEEEDVRIDLKQNRFGARALLTDAGELFESVEFQLGYGDYQHRELEGDAVGTTFRRRGYDARLTAVHSPLGRFTGAVGLHLKDDRFSAVGEEAFIPANDMQNLGLFLVERLDTERGTWEFGGRVEEQSLKLRNGALGRSRETMYNVSAGYVHRLAEGLTAAANATYAERAPNASELFAFGPHIGTNSFEIGDATLGKESSRNLDLSLRRSMGFVTGELTAFYSSFSDFIYLQELEDEDVAALYGDLDTHGLHVYRNTAVDADFYGYELSVKFHLIEQQEQRLHFDLLVDQTRATNGTDRSNLPRIPTRRAGARVEYEVGPWLLGLEGRYSRSASHLAPDEVPTDSYLLWHADARYRLASFDMAILDLFVVGRNLSDEEARPHTSFLKDIAPLAGRDIRFGVRALF